MTIAICGSMQFHKEMRETKALLERKGHVVFVPKSIELMDTIGYVHPTEDGERVAAKIEHDFIREHFRKIQDAEAILVLNSDIFLVIAEYLPAGAQHPLDDCRLVDQIRQLF